MNRKSVRSVGAVLAIFATLGVLAGIEGIGGGLIGGTVDAAGSVKPNEAAATSVLIDSRSAVQVSAAKRNAKNVDIGFFGRSCLPGVGTGAGPYGDSLEEEVSFAALADSYKRAIEAVPFQRAQTANQVLNSSP